MSNRIMTRRGIATVIVAMIGLYGMYGDASATGGRPLPEKTTGKDAPFTGSSLLPTDVATLQEALRQERKGRAQDRKKQNASTLAWKTKAIEYKARVKVAPDSMTELQLLR